jgi:hypothetical protein
MGMPRNPDKARHAVSLRMPPDLLEALDAACDERVIGRNKLVEFLLRDGLRRLPSPSLTTPEPKP